MDGYQQEISLIKKVLEENPKGMTVTDISRKIKINRNSVAKYLDIMRISGYVEMITFGPAKVFFPSRRVPISDMLNYTSDFIAVFDRDLQVTMINNSFLFYLNSSRDKIIGESAYETLLKRFQDNSEILIGLKSVLEGKKFKHEIELEDKGEMYYFLIKIVPTSFEDGRIGGTIIISDITERKIIQKALKDSEQNFKKLLKKISNK